MRYRYLGNSGLQVSELSYGSWVTFSDQMDEKTAEEAMHIAFDAGVNFFDNAEVYAEGQAETMMGNILKRSGWKRSEYIISTKLYWGGKGINQRGLSRKHIIEGMNESLQRLQLEYTDLVFCHRPDYQTPLEETVRAMNQLIRDGKAFYWGTSEWPVDMILEAYQIARREHLIPPVMEQPQYNMFHRERVESEYDRAYKRMGLGLTIWSPLAGGILTGKYNDATPEDTRAFLKKYEYLKERLTGDTGRQRIEKARKLAPIADKIGITLAQMSLAWCLKNENVSTVITGASKPAQVEENMKAVEAVDKLTEPVMAEIEAVLGNKPAKPMDFKKV